MNDLKKRIFKNLGRFAVWIAPQIYEVAAQKLDQEDAKRASVRMTQTRQTVTNTKATKQTKGDK